MSLYRTILAAAVALSASVGAASAQVVVSSKIDTEGGVLGNIIKLVLNANNIKTTDRIQLGATPVVRKAITAGEIDIYPEYTGNAAYFFEKADDPVWKDAAKGYEQAKKLDYDANKLVWLTPSPANNTWAIALRKDVAEPNKLVTLSDFGKYVKDGGQIVLAASAEFVNSAAALPAFQTTYGFTLKPDQLITLSGGDTAATIAARPNTNDRPDPAAADAHVVAGHELRGVRDAHVDAVRRDERQPAIGVVRQHDANRDDQHGDGADQHWFAEQAVGRPAAPHHGSSR
jgi:osmoprotectant transport system substrate-binding protein